MIVTFLKGKKKPNRKRNNVSPNFFSHCTHLILDLFSHLFLCLTHVTEFVSSVITGQVLHLLMCLLSTGGMVLAGPELCTHLLTVRAAEALLIKQKSQLFG